MNEEYMYVCAAKLHCKTCPTSKKRIGLRGYSNMGWCSDRRDDDDSPSRSAARLVHLASKGATDRVRALLKDGTSVTENKRDGTSALHAAAAGGHVECAAVLLEYGAPVNAADNYGHRPLLEAARHGSVEMLQLLLAHSADVALTSFQDVTPLMRACAEGHMPATSLLLAEARSDPMHTAARGGDHALSL